MTKDTFDEVFAKKLIKLLERSNDAHWLNDCLQIILSFMSSGTLESHNFCVKEGVLEQLSRLLESQNENESFIASYYLNIIYGMFDDEII